LTDIFNQALIEGDKVLVQAHFEGDQQITVTVEFGADKHLDED
jgi:hypothetical protein